MRAAGEARRNHSSCGAWRGTKSTSSAETRSPGESAESTSPHSLGGLELKWVYFYYYTFSIAEGLSRFSDFGSYIGKVTKCR